MKWLYPYDKTVFPGGIAGPVLQWTPQSGGAVGRLPASALQPVRLQGLLRAARTPMQLPVPDKAWTTAWAQSTGADDPLKVRADDDVGHHRERPDHRGVDVRARQPQGRRLLQHVHLAAGEQQRRGDGHPARREQAEPVPRHQRPVADRTVHLVPLRLRQRRDDRGAASPVPGRASCRASRTICSRRRRRTPPRRWRRRRPTTGASARVYPDGSRVLTDGQPGQTGARLPGGTGRQPRHGGAEGEPALRSEARARPSRSRACRGTR